MPIELKIPEFGESITEVEIGHWLKQPGEPVKKDDAVVTLESEKATVDLPSPEAGTITRILKREGDVVKIGEVIAYLEAETRQAEAKEPKKTGSPPEAAAPAKAQTAARPEGIPRRASAAATQPKDTRPRIISPPEPRETTPKPEELPAKAAPAQPPTITAPRANPSSANAPQTGGREEEVVAMSRLRRTVAERLVEAHRNAALLTTFNEVDMTRVMALRKEHGEAFQRKYAVKLGFMSFFVKACVDALKQSPELNAEVRGTDIVYRNYYDIGVAIGGAKGLVVPVLRNAERLSFAETESAVAEFSRRARENQLKPEELQGGTFTISNGGVYGSLLSTPIVNPPQSGVLGMHAIQERPVAVEGNVVIRPMMYVALTYDHRIVDGREAVTFLKRIRDAVENPARMLLEI